MNSETPSSTRPVKGILILNTLLLTKLGQIYRMELLAATSLMEINKNIHAIEVNDSLSRFAGLHATNMEGLAEMFSVMNYTPADDVAIPATIESLLAKRDFPDRLLFSWLNEFETQLSDQYKKLARYHEMNPSSLPLVAWKHLEEVRHRQDCIAIEVATITSKTTEILDLAIWQS